MTSPNIPLQDAEAFCRFYESIHLMVYRFIYGMTGGPAQDVEDLTAETFMRAWKGRSRFIGNEKAAIGWIFTIARNIVVDVYRRRNGQGTETHLDELDLISPGSSPEEQLLLREQLGMIFGFLDDLPVATREMYVLRYLFDWPIKEIADHLEILENTISVTLRRATIRIKEQWSDKYEERTHGT